jgi:hypothetical protein
VRHSLPTADRVVRAELFASRTSHYWTANQRSSIKGRQLETFSFDVVPGGGRPHKRFTSLTEYNYYGSEYIRLGIDGLPTTLGFARHSNAIVFPHWFVVVVCTGAAALPWLSWSRTFSLRTLLIGMTMLAVGLGLVVWAVDR